jgi:hypothetical protein
MQRNGRAAQEVLEGRGRERHATQPDRRLSQRGLARIREYVALSANQGHIAETYLVLRGRSLFGFSHVVIIQTAPRSVIPEPWSLCVPRVQTARARSSADRASASGAEGQGFKSLRARQSILTRGLPRPQSHAPHGQP